jgi:hypothetical protein
MAMEVTMGEGTKRRDAFDVGGFLYTSNNNRCNASRHFNQSVGGILGVSRSRFLHVGRPFRAVRAHPLGGCVLYS